jgi:hypothetical protein
MGSATKRMGDSVSAVRDRSDWGAEFNLFWSADLQVRSLILLEKSAPEGARSEERLSWIKVALIHGFSEARP